VTDYFKRIEFQMRGSPHAHCLLCIRKDGITDNDIHNNDDQQKVLDLISKTVSAVLEKPISDTTNSIQADQVNLNIDISTNHSRPPYCKNYAL
jgi:hypothetical protein